MNPDSALALIAKGRALRRIDHDDDIRDGLAELARRDKRLKTVIAATGAVPLRRSPPGFASLVSIVVAQQVSKAAADTIHARLIGLVDPLTPENVLAGGEDPMRAAGLSRPKQKTLLAVAQAVADGVLDLDAVLAHDAADAIAHMTAVHGIGAWTAEIYLLFCAGHPDIFPARDVALQAAVAGAFDLAARPGEKELIRIAESWSPWRGVAARLFWAYYAIGKGREAGTGAQNREKA
ncbi:MAG: DNA-3-methyladenine glycosylase 2 family protein [Phyllobacteriaceae bacterium]|nr:DNA-3-methyladenine glycosylase 2 family protein [Phyllobacteriaceae bacterium]